MKKMSESVVAEPLSRKKIREYAKYIREIFGMEKELCFPVVACIESMDHEDDDFNFLVEPDSEMSNMYGYTSTDNGVMKIRESVYEGAINGNPRDRFTLAHELGHYFMHTPDRISLARGERPKYCDPEWQANVFAAELLIPMDLVKGMDVEDIIVKCKVSRECATIQKKYY